MRAEMRRLGRRKYDMAVTPIASASTGKTGQSGAQRIHMAIPSEMNQ
jgi:hypothetical protein